MRRPRSVIVEHRGRKVTATPHRPPVASSPHWSWRAQLDRRNILSGRMARGDVTAALVAAIDGALDERAPEPDAVAVGVGQVLDWFVAAQERDPNLSPDTPPTTRRAAVAIIRIAGGWPLARALSPAGLSELAELLRERYARTTTWAYLTKLLASYRWAVEQGVLEALEAPPRLPKAYRGRKVLQDVEQRVPAPSELWAALDALGPSGTRKDLASWELAVYVLGVTGARVSEARLLAWAGVHDDGMMQLPQERGVKTGSRWLCLPEEGGAYWRPRLAEARTRSATSAEPWRVFGHLPPSFGDSLRDRLRRACALAGTPVLRPKDLRVMASNALLDAGADPGIEAAAFGHTPQTAGKHYRRARVRHAARALARTGLGVRPELAEVVTLRR